MIIRLKWIHKNYKSEAIKVILYKLSILVKNISLYDINYILPMTSETHPMKRADPYSNRKYNGWL